MLNLEKKFSKRKSLIIILTQVGIFIAQYFLNESKVHFLFTVMMIMSLFHFKLKYILISILAILSLWLSYFFTSMHPLKFIFTTVFGLNLSKYEKTKESATFLLNEDVKTKGEIKTSNDEKIEQKNVIEDVKNDENEKSHKCNEKNNPIESFKEEANQKDEQNNLIEYLNKDKNEKVHECNQKNNLAESSKEESNKKDEQNNLTADLNKDKNEKSQEVEERNDVLESSKEKLNENNNHDNITEFENEKKEECEEIKHLRTNEKIIKIMSENIDKIPRRNNQNISNEIVQEEKLKYQSSQEKREECEFNKSKTKCNKSDNEKTNDSNPDIKIFETEESILDESLVNNDKAKDAESKNTSTPVEAEKTSDRCNESLTGTNKNIIKRSYLDAVKNLEKRNNTKEKKQKSVKFKINGIKDSESSSDNEISMLNQGETVDKSSQEPKDDKNIILQVESANCEEIYSRLGFKVYDFSFKIKNISVIQFYLKDYFENKAEETKMKCLDSICSLFNKDSKSKLLQGNIFDLIEAINLEVNEGKNDQVKVKYIHILENGNSYLISLYNTIENKIGFRIEVFREIEDSEDSIIISTIIHKRKIKHLSTNEINLVFLLK